jgi:hypothetical protein
MRSLPLIALGLASCATEQGYPAAGTGVTYLVCGSAMRVDISHNGHSAIVREADGRETRLQRIKSSLGERYTGASISILRSGDTYIYTDRNGNTLNCDPLPR